MFNTKLLVYFTFFLHFQNLMCILHIKISQFRLVIFHVLNSYMWLRATMLDNTCLILQIYKQLFPSTQQDFSLLFTFYIHAIIRTPLVLSFHLHIQNFNSCIIMLTQITAVASPIINLFLSHPSTLHSDAPLCIWSYHSVYRRDLPPILSQYELGPRLT